MLRLLLATLLLFHLAIARAETPADYSETLALMRDACLAEDDVATALINTDDRSLVVTMKDGLTLTAYPDNLQLLLRTATTPAERASLIQKHTNALLETARREGSKKWYDSKDLLAVVRPASAVPTSATSPPARLPFVAGLSIFFAFDTPGNIHYASQKAVANLAPSNEALLAFAMKNFAAKGLAAKIEGKDPYFVIIDGNYEATVLLDRAFWDQQDEKLGVVIVAPIARDLIIFADRWVPGKEQVLRKVADKYFGQVPYPLTDKLLMWVNHRWVELPE
jgi:uncharacterized protein YtpQ (UPF0354 family)